MRNLVIIGAGGFGREALQYALDVQESEGLVEWKAFGFLDDNLDSLNGYSRGYQVIGTIRDHKPQSDNVYICAIGDPRTKLKICEAFVDKGANFINLIHPTAIIGRTCKMGVGNIICPHSSLTSDVTLGNFITINLKSSCGHDSYLGDGCTLSPFCDVTGFASLGKGVFMGSHASVCPGAKVGDFAVIGAGAVVLKEAEAGATVVGVPAKKVLKNLKYNET